MLQINRNRCGILLVRDLQHLLDYEKWNDFKSVIFKAIFKTKTTCEIAKNKVSDHFADAGKMVDLGSGSQREVPDIMLTCYAYYLIAQNGDPRKEKIAFAQIYFAGDTEKISE